jgi:cephalosporin-C deacetylase-like acetyl esterase
MFSYFEDNYTWSSAVNLALMAGGEVGQMDQFLHPLRHKATAAAEDWANAWDAMAKHQTNLAAEDVAQGHRQSASARYLRASIYHLTGERQIPPGPSKTQLYTSALSTFTRAIPLMPYPLQRVEVPSPDGILPGYIIPVPHATGSVPLVIFYNGFDVTKETLYGIIRTTFADRGIACLVIDTPGTGEPLRLRGVATRADYEVPTRAIVDYLIANRPDVDAERLGLLGISLGGYYAPRGAAFEPRIKAVAAWGAIWDYGAIWRRRWETQSTQTSVPHWQLPWVIGATDMQMALEKVREFRLEDVLSKLKQPFLVLHGEADPIPLADAEKVVAAAGSSDKTLRVFSRDEGGAEHVGADDPDPSRQLVADWFLEKLLM